MLNKQFFPLLLGLIDGILTVLALATGHVLKIGEVITFTLAFNVAFATSLSGACIYFFSEYSRQRHRLIHAESELNLARHGKLATTRLGKQIFKESCLGMVVSLACNFMGAMIPLCTAILLPHIQWIAIVIAFLMLLLLGIGIAKLVYGNTLKWSVVLLLTGILVAFIGYKLNIV